MMPTTCFEPEGSSSGRQLCNTGMVYYMLYNTCTYNRLPEDEPSGLNRVEDIIS
jgi:hypothetical protein